MKAHTALPSLAMVLVFLLFAGGCAGDYGSGPAYNEGRQRHGPSYIPPREMPPPGQCRVWYPDTNVDEQPPARDCEWISKNTPPGAWLIHGARPEANNVRVDVYHHRFPGKIVEVRYFNPETGSLIKVEDRM